MKCVPRYRLAPLQLAPLQFAMMLLPIIVLQTVVLQGVTKASSDSEELLTAEQTEFFESKIRPVLVAHCYECHAGDSSVPKGNFRLDHRASIRQGGDSGPAVVPGKTSESLLLSALRYDGLEMPPQGKLPESVIDDFEHWIQMGAPDPRTDAGVPKRSTEVNYQKGLEFWAFQKPVRPTVPAVADVSWPNNDIDRFVLHALEQKQLKPAPPADRRTLIRRAWFDLTGLPPEPKVVEAFVLDSSESAFEKVIDDLLASPHYGERWARYWLDLARYAEDQAHTFKARVYPQGYLYRDWVVQAFNDDMPYDQFLRLQIAGEQLGGDQPWRHRAATGLFALGPVYYQDNGEQDKALADEWDDRIDTLMRGTQALTVSCARCHDHKYDPISMTDYYGLAGIFASSEYRELPSVSDDMVQARRVADQAVQDQQLHISRLLTEHAPAARLKLTSKIPDYMQAAYRILKSQAKGEGKPERKRLDKIAKDAGLNRELLERWLAWLTEESGSGAIGSDRPYLNGWREFRKNSSGAGVAEEGSDVATDAGLSEVARQLQKDVEQLISERGTLLSQFGDSYAFVSAEDRVQVEPGVIPLGNLFDDRKGASLSSAVTSDPFKSSATGNSLGVNRVVQGWGRSTQIAEGIHFDFTSLGSDTRQHGQITNDGWSSEGGLRTLGQKCDAHIGRTEQGIGMHANALITFDLEEIRRSGLIPADQSMVFRVDRAGINDDSFGNGSSVHIGVILSKAHQRSNVFDAVIAGYLNGKPAKIAENDKVYYFQGVTNPPILSDGQFVSFDVPIEATARYLTIVVTGAQLSDSENTISSDHAVLSGARIEYSVTPSDEARRTAAVPLSELPEAEQAKRRVQATLLSEMFDDRGVLGLAPDQIDSLLEGEPASTLASLKDELKQREKTAAAITITMAHSLMDGSGRDLKVYLAGDPKKHGDTAPRALPAILTSGERRPFASTGSGRAELADALTSPENPLTARVMANRIWAGHFGYGLVRTLGNFGQLGERPSHPELLDFLAVEMMESGWSLKRLHRQILLSAAWQQSSTGDPAGQETDPENRLLWRMNRRRLEVEPWRDAVLSVSGQLNADVGGPSSELNDSHRRRTLYGYVSRHRLNDLLRLFDFPDPNITAGERSVTTVPLQQLFVLNSDFMIAQAKALASRLEREASTDDERIQRTYALLYCREPADDERHAALDFLAGTHSAAGDTLSPLEQYCLAMLGTNEFAYVD